ncbi:MAG TPA: hypothetical protein VKY65_00280 [Alphaproteobacteria bacterium]|nr:hypothetical protein [Alphaproteobacteria bacterium]
MRKWLFTFVLSCALACFGVLFALWAMNGFNGLGIGVQGTVALVLGIAITVAIGITLMSLTFASDRSAKDEQVHHLDLGRR